MNWNTNYTTDWSAESGIPGNDGGIRANIGFLVDIVKDRGGTASRGTRTREIEKFIIRQPPTGEKDEYDS